MNIFVCAKCCQNTATKDLVRPKTPEQFKEFADLSYCRLRQIAVPDPYGIWCENWLSWKHPDRQADERFHVIRGRAYDRNGQVVHSPEGYTDEDERRDRPVFSRSPEWAEQQEALRAFARMYNTLDVFPLEPLLADDFVYESQMVINALRSKQDFLKYIGPKMAAIARTGATVFAEMGEVIDAGLVRPCVLLAQPDKDSLKATGAGPST